MTEPTAGGDIFETYLLLRNTNDTLVRVRSEELRKLGVSGRQSAIMTVIRRIEKEGGVPTSSEISRWLIRRPHTILDTLNRMERQGLIGRARDQTKKNTVRVFITPKGQEYCEKSAKSESLSIVVGCLTATERQILIALLDKLRIAGQAYLGIEQRIPWP